MNLIHDVRCFLFLFPFLFFLSLSLFLLILRDAFSLCLSLTTIINSLLSFFRSRVGAVAAAATPPTRTKVKTIDFLKNDLKKANQSGHLFTAAVAAAAASATD